MGRLEAVKKTSRRIRKIGKIFQIVFGIFTGILLISVSILFVLRNTLNGMTVVFQTGVDFAYPYLFLSYSVISFYLIIARPKMFVINYLTFIIKYYMFLIIQEWIDSSTR